MKLMKLKKTYYVSIVALGMILLLAALYFITYTPDKSGFTSNEPKVTVASDTGSSIAMDTSYKSQGGNSGTRFTIFKGPRI